MHVAAMIENGVAKGVAPRKGILAALWIPWDEFGALNHDLLAAHMEWLIGKGIHGFLALASTGEFARMEYGKRLEALEAIIRNAKGLPVIANISSIRQEEVVALGRKAADLGAVGVALMPPMFFPLSQADILEFFVAAAREVKLPFYLYNYPEVTGNRIGLEVLSAFAERAPLVGVKQSGNELEYHHDLVALGRKRGFSVFTAADPLLIHYLQAGAAGCLGGVPNFAPELMLEVYHAHEAGCADQAREASARLLRIGEMLKPLNLPMNVRCALEARGFSPGALKTVVSAETLATYETIRKELRVLFSEWGMVG